MKKALVSILAILFSVALHAQIVVTVGSALQQNPGSDVHLPVSVTGLDGATGGIGITGLELHIGYSGTNLVYDTTLNFNSLTPVTQWYFGANGSDYGTNWLEPSGNKINVPDQTVLFEISFHYLGGSTQLIFDSTRCLLIDSAYNIIPNVHFVNGQVTPSQGSDESRWNGTGTWNMFSNWSNGVPGDNTNAIIESGEVSVSSAASCKALTINAGTSLNLMPKFSLTVLSDYANNGTMNLQSDISGNGSLIVNGSVSGTGVNNFQRYLDAGTLISSPVNGATASVFGSNIVEKYTENSASWQAILPSDNLEPGMGYKIGGTSPGTFSFQGIFPASDQTMNSLSYNSGGQPATQGLNLLGNPYPSAIQWEQGNWARTNLEYAVYVWSDYKYVTWNGQCGALKDGIIPAMQGFFVKSNASGASLTIPAGSRIHSTVSAYKAPEAVANVISMRLESISDTNHYDEAFVQILSGSSASFDGNHDARKLSGTASYPQVYTKTSDLTAVSINAQPDYASVPVEFTVPAAGSYKFTFGQYESFDPGQALFFEDKTAGTSINIRNTGGVFVFTSEGTPETGRFVLHFHEVGFNELSADLFSVWNNGKVIHIEPKTSEHAVERTAIYNLAGQCVFASESLEMPATLNVENLPGGFYILKLETIQGFYSKKLVIR